MIPCPGCRRPNLTRDDFYSHSARSTGLQPKCKQCQSDEKKVRRVATEIAMPETTTGERLTREGEGERECLTSVSRTIKTLAEALAAAEVDETVWAVERFTVNKWNSGRSTADDKWDLAELWQVKVWLKRKLPKVVTDAADAMIARMAEHAPAYPRIWKPRPIEKPHMLVMALVDVHFGKLAWEPETGENCDLKITERVWRDAVEDLVAKSAGASIDKIVLPLGNDFFNMDNLAGTTTNGTPQDCDGRYAKILETGQMAAVWAIDYLLNVAPVHIVLVPGNHDRATSWHLVQFLRAWYRNTDRVTIDDSPRPRKSVRYGCSLVAFTHGDEERHSSLPAIMATQWPAEWAETTTHDWIVGHFHKAKEVQHVPVDTHDGVAVRTAQSLSGRDAWHDRKGYMARRAADAFLYSFDEGFAGYFTTNVRRGAFATPSLN